MGPRSKKRAPALTTDFIDIRLSFRQFSLFETSINHALERCVLVQFRLRLSTFRSRIFRPGCPFEAPKRSFRLPGAKQSCAPNNQVERRPPRAAVKSTWLKGIITCKGTWSGEERENIARERHQTTFRGRN